MVKKKKKKIKDTKCMDNEHSVSRYGFAKQPRFMGQRVGPAKPHVQNKTHPATPFKSMGAGGQPSVRSSAATALGHEVLGRSRTLCPPTMYASTWDSRQLCTIRPNPCTYFSRQHRTQPGRVWMFFSLTKSKKHKKQKRARQRKSLYNTIPSDFRTAGSGFVFLTHCKPSPQHTPLSRLRHRTVLSYLQYTLAC